MSKLKEYLDLVRKGIPNIDKIAEGLINQVKMEYDFLPEHEQEEIARRRLICQECPLNSIKALKSEEYKELYKENYKTDRSDLHCSVCSCIVNTKTSSLASECGLSYYNESNPNNKQPLKWTKYVK